MRPGKNKTRLLIILCCTAAVLLAGLLWAAFLRPTRILVVNTTLAQQADLALNNDCRRIRLRFADAGQLATDAHPLRGTDAVLIFSRGLYLDEGQVARLEKAGGRGLTIFTNTLNNQHVDIQCNLTEEQQQALLGYFRNPSRHN